MPNWNNVAKLDQTIQTTKDDVVLSGHGSFVINGPTTPVPQGFEFWVLAPLGATITDALGQSLEDMEAVNYLGMDPGVLDPQTGLRHPSDPANMNLVTVRPTVYAAGTHVPDYVLSFPDGLELKPGGPHMIGVAEDTQLSALWARVLPFAQPNKTIRIFWAACTFIQGAGNQLVYGQA